MEDFKNINEYLQNNQYIWLITGVAGFIGSNLLKTLLSLNQKIIGIDNFITGRKINLAIIEQEFSRYYKNFEFIEGDIRDKNICKQITKNVDFVLHQAALNSIPRSLKNPIATHDHNVNGFLNIFLESIENNVKSFVYASSSSVYGDLNETPNVENRIGNPLSPYALSKKINEEYACVFAKNYKLKPIGLRYFNVFGPMQDPNSEYAAVIPKWINLLLNNETAIIFGDGKTTRDFCYIDNVVQANLLAALTTDINTKNKIYNIAYGKQTSLLNLYDLISSTLNKKNIKPKLEDFRKGDRRYSLADINLAKRLLKYKPNFSVEEGIKKTVTWFMENI